RSSARKDESERALEAVLRMALSINDAANGLRADSTDTFFQYARRASRAPSRPPAAKPSASTTALTPPALLPLTPSNSSGLFLEQPVEHAPRDGAVAAAALQRQIDDFPPGGWGHLRQGIRRDLARWSWPRRGRAAGGPCARPLREGAAQRCNRPELGEG